jgi:hypothetical protein
MNRQKQILVALLALFAISLIYSFTHQPPLKTVATLKYTPGATADASRQVNKPRDENKLHLELLDQELPRFSGFRRNIFQPIFHDEMKSPFPVAAAKPTLPIPPPPPAPAPPPPPPPAPAPDPVRTEIARFTFLGFLQKDNRKIVFLSRDKEIVLAKKGDKIAGKYEVANITDEALTINLPASGEQIVIPLVENKPLRSR